jgi:hypothetical protein
MQTAESSCGLINLFLLRTSQNVIPDTENYRRHSFAGGKTMITLLRLKTYLSHTKEHHMTGRRQTLHNAVRAFLSNEA